MKRFKLVLENFWEDFKEYPSNLLLTIVMTIIIVCRILHIILFPIVEFLLGLYWIFRWLFYVNFKIRYTKNLNRVKGYAEYDYKTNIKTRKWGLLLTNILNQKLANKRLKKEGETYGKD